MGETEETGFVIRDKRGRSREESVSKPVAEPSTDPTTTTPHPPDAGPSEPAPPLSFSSFIFSLGTSALMLMGEQFSPDQPAPGVNLPQAKEIIDILSLLEEKTKGNLTEEEATMIRDMLYTLRMKYVESASGTAPSS